MSIVNRKGKRIDVYLDEKDYEDLLYLCNKHDITKSNFVRKAVNHFIKINSAAEVRKEVKDLGIRQKLNINYTAKKGD